MKSNKPMSEVNRGWFAHVIGMAYEIANADKDLTDEDFDALAKDGGSGGMAVEDFGNNFTEDDVKEFLKYWEKVVTR